MFILAVDDDKEDLEIFKEAVEEVDATIRSVELHNGQDVLDYLQREGERPDYIFLDINMPIMNGLDCLREIRQMRNLEDVPVVILSTSSNRTDIKACLSYGATFLSKPASFRQLVNDLKKILLSKN
jgi:CheY-like chemotaxis protein